MFSLPVAVSTLGRRPIPKTGYVKHFLSFLGLSDVQFVYAEKLAVSEAEQQAAVAQAHKAIARLDILQRIAA